MEPELKPCPFCGGEAEIRGVTIFWVQCKDCHVETLAEDDEETVIKTWKRRENYA